MMGATMKVQIMYYGRPSSNLMMTSEQMEIPDEVPKLMQVLDRLRERGYRWSYELDQSHLICTVNDVVARSTDILKESDEIAIFSRKSWLDA
jgi:molybdopterin converting factor small subunit